MCAHSVLLPSTILQTEQRHSYSQVDEVKHCLQRKPVKDGGKNCSGYAKNVELKHLPDMKEPVLKCM